ncbi:hypothetical protein FPZ24_02125 [Sphingomonas panacisoli]|uniref:DUF1579 domain-containing protein n=1 Tax=Sphingomonas panacisoli TaxID=1813879 RepID=A0A5B8LEX2_9SPHN|nr:hypothetical protein [Sphingomonas panacisoli]QDZ06419.1 hypothetical protein FPZ24_02125 [Sphingomonas panacisoli]
MKRIISIALVLAAAGANAQQKPTPAVPPQTKGCDTPESHQFDFWVGNWETFNNSDGSPAGTNNIEKLYKGCTIRENWIEPGLTGGSLTTYDVRDGKWHQAWTDSSGSWRTFVGGMVGGSMVMIWSHPSVRMPGKTAQERITITPNPDGTVRQHGELSFDSVNWVDAYDITYRRIAKRRTR